MSEEIEGRTAVTLMSKPISRRQFLLGKFAGILLAAQVLTVTLGWLMVWTQLFMTKWNPVDAGERVPDPAWLINALQDLTPGDPARELLRGAGASA